MQQIFYKIPECVIIERSPLFSFYLGSSSLLHASSFCLFPVSYYVYTIVFYFNYLWFLSLIYHNSQWNSYMYFFKYHKGSFLFFLHFKFILYAYNRFYLHFKVFPCYLLIFSICLYIFLIFSYFNFPLSSFLHLFSHFYLITFLFSFQDFSQTFPQTSLISTNIFSYFKTFISIFPSSFSSHFPLSSSSFLTTPSPKARSHLPFDLIFPALLKDTWDMGGSGWVSLGYIRSHNPYCHPHPPYLLFTWPLLTIYRGIFKNPLPVWSSLETWSNTV